MNALEKLREGYARDLIDLETFERFVGWILEGRSVALPSDVLALGPAGPASASSFASVLKGAWADAPGAVLTYEPKGHDWHDGKGPVHSLSLEQHRKNQALQARRDKIRMKHDLR